MRNVLVLGETSYIGRHLVDSLLCPNVRVIAVNNPHTKNIERSDIKVLYADILNPESFRENMGLLYNLTEGEVDCIFVFSWAGSKDLNNTELNKGSADGLFAVLREILDKIQVRKLVQIGSQAEYGWATGIVTEETICVPNTEYGKYKLEFALGMSELCKNVNVDFVEIRLRSIYGNGCMNLFDRVLKELLKGKTVYMKTDCSQKWDSLYIDDCIEALVIIMNSRIEGVYNVGNDEKMKLLDYLETIRKMTNSAGEVVYGKAKEKYTMDATFDDSRFRLLTGWKPRYSFEEGIRKMISQEHMFAVGGG